MKLMNKELLLSRYGDDCTLVETGDYKAQNFITLDMNSPAEFFDFVKNRKTDLVYYCYSFYNKEDYFIPQDMFDDFPTNIQEYITNYNDEMKSTNFDDPFKLTLLFIKDGAFIQTYFENYWIEDSGRLHWNEKLHEIEEMFDKYFHEEREKKIKQENEEKNSLEGIILADKDFAYMKNQRLRQDYLLELLEKDEFIQYAHLFHGLSDRGISIPIKNFMDRVWIKHKERTKKEK